jgi:hypothetical protein
VDKIEAAREAASEKGKNQEVRLNEQEKVKQLSVLKAFDLACGEVEVVEAEF